MTEPEIKLVTDHALLREAFSWSENAPRWFRETEEPESVEEFLETADQRLFYGIFDGELTALIRLTPFAESVFSIDLFAKRSTDFSVLSTAAESIQAFLYDQGIAQGFFGWIPTFNNSVRKLYENLGFTACGVVCYRGRTHNRPVKWLLMTNQNEG